MSEIGNILKALENTREFEILNSMEKAYEKIESEQKEWYKKTDYVCPSGCGECCRNFEPDLLEEEALYMAAWLIENKRDLAEEVSKGAFPFPLNNGCRFWNELTSYHCTIYGGRPAVCRFFGACGNRGKTGKVVFKPCKFYPKEKLAQYKVPLKHIQYEQKEIELIFGTLPPVMNDLMEGIISINPGESETSLIHECLPKAVNRLLWVCNMNKNK